MNKQAEAQINSEKLKKAKQIAESSIGLNKIVKIKLANSIFAAVFLITGVVYERLFPLQRQSAQLIIMIAAIAVIIPILIEAVKGLLSKEPQFMTEQLVCLAVFACMCEGDFIVAAIIPIILVFGHFLEEKSIMGVEESIAALKKLNSSEALLLEGGEERHTEPSQLKIGDKIVCYPGQIIAADGVVVSGESNINQAPITGESLPIEAYSGISVFAGTENIDGKLIIRVTKQPSDTVFNKIINMLSEAEHSKTPIIKIIERYLGMYFPFVTMAAAITLFLTGDISRAITVLIISCPCALVLACPTAMIAALVNASKHGIMIKNSAFLETLAEIDTVIFDKTGTVTLGSLAVNEIVPENGVSAKELLDKAGMCAIGSRHPVSAAIISYLHENKIEIAGSSKQTELHGKGVRAEGDSETAYLGKLNWILSETGLIYGKIQDLGSVSVWVATDKAILGYISFSDMPRPEIKETVENLKKLGNKQIVLLTGDKKSIANEVGSFIGADETVAECLPQDKLAFVNAKKANECRVMFVGDGINDSLALKASDAGVAIAHGGSDIAIQNADIALNHADLRALTQMFHISLKTRAIVNQNILIGTGISLLMMILAIGGVINPITGAILHNLGPVFVVINSARLLKSSRR